MQTTQIETNKNRPPGHRTEPALAGSIRQGSETKKRIEIPRAKQSSQQEKLIEFGFEAARARYVGVAGTFNDWNAERTPLKKEGASWKARLALAPGRYEYRFVVDGQWMSDPGTKESVINPYGGTNSVIRVA